MKNKVSIITASYNQGRFIERTIQSVLNQNIESLEYVIMDGGSTDDSIEIIRKYDAKLTWVSEKDRGQSHAINKGIYATQGEIIGWLNSDDIHYPGALSSVIDYFDKNPQVDLVYGNAYHIDTEDNLIESYPTEPFDLQRLKYTCFLCQPAVFIRRSLVEKYGVMNEKLKYCMDYEYWLRVAKVGVKFGHLSKVLAGSRLYAETKTLGARVKVHKEINDMMKQTFNEVPERWISNFTHVYMQEKFSQTNIRLYTLALVLLYFGSALKWNKKISKEMRDNAKCWLIEAWKQNREAIS